MTLANAQEIFIVINFIFLINNMEIFVNQNINILFSLKLKLKLASKFLEYEMFYFLPVCCLEAPMS